ncbi:MAG: PadR family transcriptional regulator [Lachnospiraceae bacterium]|nr:PadR family transcriptional regulator [Lachnospiraceae bacterium]
MGRESFEASLSMEMRRGTIVLCVLSLLDKPAYGYHLTAELEKRGLPVEGNTLYPLLRRLSSQGLLDSSWDTDSGKPRKYYCLTDEGRRVRDAMRQEWQAMAEAVDAILTR